MDIWYHANGVMARADYTYGVGRTTRNTQYPCLMGISKRITQSAKNRHAYNVMRANHGNGLQHQLLAKSSRMRCIAVEIACHPTVVLLCFIVNLIKPPNLYFPVPYSESFRGGCCNRDQYLKHTICFSQTSGRERFLTNRSRISWMCMEADVMARKKNIYITGAFRGYASNAEHWCTLL